MRASNIALGLAGCAFAAVGWAQLDLRLPSDRPARTDASCRVCGEIRSIREVRMEAPVAVAPNPARTTGDNPNNWAVVGAAVYLPTGTGSSESPRMGAVGTPEMVERFGGSTYEVTIRMDDGERKVLQRRDGTLFRIGDRVSVSGGLMERL